MKALLLPSTDGQNFMLTVIAPEGLSFDEAHEAARKIMNDAKLEFMKAPKDWAAKAAWESWDWDTHLQPALEKAGFIVPEQRIGPTWDEEIPDPEDSEEE